jgi:hypothetical protein
MKGRSHLLLTHTARETSMYNDMEMMHYERTGTDKTGGL